MSVKKISQRFDDLDGTPGAQPFVFGAGDKLYTIDLAPKHAVNFKRALDAFTRRYAKYIEAATPVPTAGEAPAGSASHFVASFVLPENVQAQDTMTITIPSSVHLAPGEYAVQHVASNVVLGLMQVRSDDAQTGHILFNARSTSAAGESAYVEVGVKAHYKVVQDRAAYLEKVREWASLNGYNVGTRGRISAEILEKYKQAQSSLEN